MPECLNVHGSASSTVATVLVCAVGAGPVLQATVVGRAEFVRRVAGSLEEAAKFADQATLVLIERDLPWALALVRFLRGTAATQSASIAIIAPGDDPGPAELELLQAGANAIFRLPASPEWDRRLARLAQVSLRRKARVAVHLKVEASLGPAEEAFTADTLDLSETGMLVECGWPLEIGSEVDFALQLPPPLGLLSGRARVMRLAAHHRYGLEFTALGGEEYERLRAFVAEEFGEPPATARTGRGHATDQAVKPSGFLTACP